ATGGSLQLQVPGLRWRFHPGDEAQLPDPLIEAQVGAANAVAHRGLCYLVFEDVPLDAFGNRIPSVSAEVVAAGGQSTIETTTTLPSAAAWSGTLYESDFERATVLLLGTEPDDTTQRFLAAVNTLTMEARRAFGPSLVQFAHAIATQDGKVYVVHGPTGDVWLRKYDLDTGALLGQFESTTSAFTTTRTRFRVPLRGDCLIARVLGPFGWRRFFLVPPQGSPAAVYCIDTDAMTYVFGSSDTGDERIMEAPANGWLAAGEEREGASDIWYAAPVASGGIELWRIVLSYAAVGGPQIAGVSASLVATYTNAALGLTGTGTLTAVAFDYDPDDNALILAASPNSPAETAICKLRADGSIAWQRSFPSFLSAARSGTKRVFGGTWAIHSAGANQVIVLDTRTGATVQTAGTSTMPTNAAFAWDSDIKAAFYAGTAGTYRRLLMLRQGSETVPLASIVSALCARAGLAPAEFNAAALTDSVRGFVVARPMSAREAIQPLATAFAFDAVERDDVLVFRKRGGATATTLTHADLVRRGDAPVIDEQRAQDAELPRAISVRHIDPERAYEIGTQRWQRPRAPSATMASTAEATVDLPLVLTATEAKAIARRLILAAWRERTRFGFAGTTQHLRLEPTDPATLVRGDGAQSRVRLISAQLGADWTVALEAVEEAPGDYTVAAIADGGTGFAPDALPAPYTTRGFTLNLPLLVDADDLAGTALRSYLHGGAIRGQTWRRADVFRSADGTAWEPAGAVLDVAAWGAVLGAVPVPASYWTWDDATVLTVQMQTGADRIEGATDLEVLNGANLAALVAEDGRVELVQFAIADALGGGRFTLRRLLRGRRGTEDAGAFASGAAFLLLDGSVVRGASPLGALNSVERFRFVGIFQTVQTATEYRRLMIGRAEQPYAPVHIAGSRDGSNNLTVTWVRRTRIGGELVDLTGAVPLAEAAELYEVDVRNAADTATLRSFTGLTSPTVTYTAAQQTTDGLTPGNPVRVHVYQMSAVAGRGRRGAAIV
uniref:phage tail protein n=1 Tax=Elioraea sp. TaxID=2185103 RepID=UPI003F714B99